MIFRTGLITVVLLFVASASNATVSWIVDSITVSAGTTDGSTTATIGSGATVTINFSVANPDGDGVAALGATAFGFDSDTIGFSDGLVAAGFFAKRINGSGVPVDPINNIAGTSGGIGSDNGFYSVPLPRSLGAPAVTGDGSVLFFNGVTTVPVFGTGDFDLGILEGATTGPGPDTEYTDMRGGSHSSLTFTGLMEGMTTITIGTDGINGSLTDDMAMVQETTPAMVSITVPEPAAAALGFAAMATVLTTAARLRRRKD